MRKHFYFASLFSMLLLVCCCNSMNGNIPNFSNGEELSKPADEKPIILSYVWHSFKELPDPNLVTHINYAFGHLDKTNFVDIDIDTPEHFREVAGLKKQNPNLKICLSIGGWGTCSEGFSQMARDVEKRKTFALNCKNLLDEYGIDGIDIDWEYPTLSPDGLTSHPDDTKNYTLMMKEIRKAIGKEKLLTLASSSGGECLNLKDLYPIVDYVNIMSYDLGTPPYHHSALYKSEHTGDVWDDEAVTLHKLKGFTVDKLVLGVPFYGHGDGTQVPGWVDYNYLITIKDKFTERWDDKAKVPYLVDNAGTFVCTFDNAKSLGYKCQYVKEKGLKGIMYWRYDADDANGTLRKAVYNELVIIV